MGHEVKGLQRTKDGIAYEDGVLTLRDGREMAWRWWGEPGGKPLLRIQGTPSSRFQRNPDESALRDSGARYLMGSGYANGAWSGDGCSCSPRSSSCRRCR